MNYFNRIIEHLPAPTKKFMNGGRTQGILLRGAFASLIINVFSAGLLFGLHIILARLMGGMQYGIYAYAMAWIAVLSVFAKLGFDIVLLRFVSAYNTAGKHDLLKGIIKTANLLGTSSGFVVAVIFALIIWMMFKKVNAFTQNTLWVSCLLIPLFVLTFYYQAILQALKKIVSAKLPPEILRPLLFGCTVIYVASISGADLSATLVMGLNVGVSLAALIILFLLMRKSSICSNNKPLPKYELGLWVRTAGPLILLSGMGIIMHQVDVLMIGVLLGPEEAGHYSVACRIAPFVSFGLLAFNVIAAPLISELFASGDKTAMQGLLTTTSRCILVSTLPVALFFAFGGQFVLSLFGTEFKIAYGALLILILGETINAGAGSVAQVMNMTGHERQSSGIFAMAAALNILMNFLLIPRLGILGAAWATTITKAFWNIWLAVFIWRRLAVKTWLT